jgi:hypothetical protein
VLLPLQRSTLQGRQGQSAIAVIGIDIGKYFFHIVGLDRRGAIVLRQKWSRGQVDAGLPTCRRAQLAWKLVLARITSVAGLRFWVTTLG